MRSEVYQPRAVPVRGAVVWYADGSKRPCTAKTWPDLPSEGVVLVQVLYEYVRATGKYLQDVLRGYDNYWQREGKFFTGRLHDMPADVPEEQIKFGMFVKDPDYLRMYNEAGEGVAATL